MSKIKKFVFKYVNNILDGIKKSNLNNLELSAQEIFKTIKRNGSIYVCGNGGSAAIANHYVVDFLKFFREKTNLKPKIFSLSNNIETITAVSNDISYKKIFSFQAESYCNENDLIIIISSSGNSENVKEILKFAKKKKIKTVGFSGFKGGYLKEKSDISIHINSQNYGISEDSHHILMHIQLQYLVSLIKDNKI
jgi:D-sedoheptulose 7-phosphate isomerase